MESHFAAWYYKERLLNKHRYQRLFLMSQHGWYGIYVLQTLLLRLKGWRRNRTIISDYRRYYWRWDSKSQQWHDSLLINRPNWLDIWLEYDWGRQIFLNWYPQKSDGRPESYSKNENNIGYYCQQKNLNCYRQQNDLYPKWGFG